MNTFTKVVPSGIDYAENKLRYTVSNAPSFIRAVVPPLLDSNYTRVGPALPLRRQRQEADRERNRGVVCEARLQAVPIPDGQNFRGIRRAADKACLHPSSSSPRSLPRPGLLRRRVKLGTTIT